MTIWEDLNELYLRERKVLRGDGKTNVIKIDQLSYRADGEHQGRC